MNIRDRDCLVVGGGEIATRKVALLQDAGARVTVMSPELTATLTQWVEEDKITRHNKPFNEHTDISDYRLVIAATNNRQINQLISDKAKAGNTPVNVVDQPDAGTFIMPSIVDRDPVSERIRDLLAVWERELPGDVAEPDLVAIVEKSHPLLVA